MSPIRRLRLCLRLSTGTGPVTRDVSCGEELRKRLLRSSWRQEMGRILVFLLATLAACAQQASSVLPEQTIRVPLKTARGRMQSMGVGIALNADASGQLKAILPGGLETRIERMPAPISGSGHPHSRCRSVGDRPSERAEFASGNQAYRGRVEVRTVPTGVQPVREGRRNSRGPLLEARLP